VQFHHRARDRRRGARNQIDRDRHEGPIKVEYAIVRDPVSRRHDQNEMPALAPQLDDVPMLAAGDDLEAMAPGSWQLFCKPQS